MPDIYAPGEFDLAGFAVGVVELKRAIEEFAAQTLIIGGGVIANQYIREKFAELCTDLGITLMIPEKDLATDNATMIGLVAHLQIENGKVGLMPASDVFANLRAVGNLSL